ncbi:DNA photolyase, partial [bacterium]|nr:DNA photolyase [bacterium]
MTVKKGGLSARDRPAIEDDPVFRALDAGDRAAILELGETFRFSFQDLKQLVTITADYRMWGMGGLRGSWPGGLRPAGPDPRREGRRELRLLEDEWRRMKAEPIVYDKSPARERPKKLTYVRHEAPGPVLGRCPVASSKTRCCNLLTLDAVMNCGFGCSYCSIQTFHETGEIMVRSDLKAKLDEIVLDPREIYHIGTGQASDSLLYGNRFSLLGTLFDFARKNRNVILELKTKSANSGGLVKASPPPNVIATWTLNTQRVIANEEHFTAALDER